MIVCIGTVEWNSRITSRNVTSGSSYNFCIVSEYNLASVTYTPLLSVDEVWQHIGRADVAFRLLALAVLPFYGFRLCRIRYRWRETYTDKAFLRLFASVLCLMGLLQIAVQFTLSYGLFLLQGGVWMLFFFGITWYELRERLWVRRTNKNLNNK